MALDVLLGLQWGDEGKGKVVDLIAPRYQVVARFQGGPNAGHTLVHDGVKHVLHQVPSGIFHPEILNVIGNGVVLDPIVFKKEILALRARGLEPARNMVISKKAHLILPTHRLLDAASEARKGVAKIGSTLKGIGPAYQDKYARSGLRIGDLIRPEFKTLYQEVKENHLVMIDFLGGDTTQLADFEAQWFDSIETLKEFKFDETEYLLNKLLTDGKDILAEGAQGSLLDIDFGSYPFVTSSSTMAAGACTGLGVAPRHIREVFGVFKAYCTRVGSGPFPTELDNDLGEKIRQNGFEFGSTTGRPRRTGWLDLPALDYASMICGVTKLMMMKADVLSGLPEVQVAIGYGKDGNKENSTFPPLPGIEPLYKKLEGWGNISTQPKTFEELPEELQVYTGFIEHQTGLPVALLSYGPDRNETISFL